MGRDLMYEIWDNQDPQLTGSRLVIMLCLADDADDNDECWLSIARIAELARITPANVTRHIKELEAAGYLIVTRTSGTHNIYVVSSTAQPQCPPAPISSDPGGVGGVGLGECGRGANPHTNPILSPGHSVAGEPPSAPAPSHSARQRNSDSARQRNITPRASAIPPRAPAQPTPRASARPPRAPTRAEPSFNALR
jgi:biotin operon repressor